MLKKNLKWLIKFILCIILIFGVFPHAVAVQGVEEESEVISEGVSEVISEDVSEEPTQDASEEPTQDASEEPTQDASEELTQDTEDDESHFAIARAEISAGGSISMNQYNGGGTIVLDQDVTASGQCQLSGTLDIDLNGHTMTMTNNAYFMLTSEKAVLNIRDGVGGGVIYASGQLVWEYSGGTFNLYEGILDGSKAASKAQQGGCVCLQRSNMGTNVFNMYGGTIRNFEATQYGGAVYVASMFSGHTSTFNMYGGTIEACYAPAGAAVYVDGSSDGPGYFYIKGGARKADGGKPKATIRCVSYNGKTVSNAIYNFGYFGLEGVVDIDGIVYLNQNNWASTTTHFIKITGRLIVVGDGYIDIDSAYPNSNAICTGHTVVENATQTTGGMGTAISQKEFYTYSSYFINSTKGLMVSEGFDPTRQEIKNGSPANWPTYQGDKYSQTYSYVDVMGQELLIQSSDSPGDKRQMQNYNYLIYTERADHSVDYAEFYSIKISKQDMNGGGPLNGAVFSLKKKVEDEDGKVTYEPIGTSGDTGDAEAGMENGETYIYIPTKDGKLMVDDGIYILEETTAPSGYVSRGELVTIEIKHKLDESTGRLVSVVEVLANNKVLTSEEQIVNSTYGDTGNLVKREVVLQLKNSTGEIQENTDYKIRIVKYQSGESTIPLAGARFTMAAQDNPAVTVASGATDVSGVLELRDANGSVLSFSNGDRYILRESEPPENYYTMDDEIQLEVRDNKLLIDGVEISEEDKLYTMPENKALHGSWKALCKGEWLIFQIYDEPMPPTWTLTARKYGTQVKEELALAGAKFTLYKLETTDGTQVETEVTTVISSDGTDGNPIGILQFVDDGGALLEFDCNAAYILREITAPVGYQLMEDIIFRVNEDGSNIEILQSDKNYAEVSYDAINRIVTLSIVDKAVYRMPETAGIGIYKVVVPGIILMCIHGVGFILLSHKYGKK